MWNIVPGVSSPVIELPGQRLVADRFTRVECHDWLERGRDGALANEFVELGQHPFGFERVDLLNRLPHAAVRVGTGRFGNRIPVFDAEFHVSQFDVVASCDRGWLCDPLAVDERAVGAVEVAQE